MLAESNGTHQAALMITYVLIVFLNLGSCRGTVATIPGFTSEKECWAAGADLKKRLGPIRRYVNTDFFACQKVQ